MNSLWAGTYVEAFLLENVDSLVGHALEQEDLDLALEWEDCVRDTTLCGQPRRSGTATVAAGTLGYDTVCRGGEKHISGPAVAPERAVKGEPVSSIVNIPSLDMCAFYAAIDRSLEVLVCVKV